MWDQHEHSKHFVGNVPVDMNTPPAVGETARLTKEGFEFDVKIDRISGDELFGEVLRIGPDAKMEGAGIKRGEAVSFNSIHIHTLYRA